MGSYLLSELLELLLGASSLSGLEKVEAQGLAQGPAVTHCDNVTDLDISEAGGQAH